MPFYPIADSKRGPCRSIAIYIYIYMGQVTKLWLSCYLVLLYLIAKPGNKTATVSWPQPYIYIYIYIYITSESMCIIFNQIYGSDKKILAGVVLQRSKSRVWYTITLCATPRKYIGTQKCILTYVASTGYRLIMLDISLLTGLIAHLLGFDVQNLYFNG